MPIARSSTTVKIAANTIYQIIGKVFSMSVTILATVAFTRFYNRQGYGEFSLMQSWPALFFVIVDFGLNAIATRELSKDWDRAQKIFGNIFLMRLVFSAIIMLVIAIILLFFPYDPRLKFGITLSLLLILTQALFATTNIIFQVKLRYDLSTLGYGIGYTLILIMIVFLSYIKADVIWVNFSYVLGGIVTVILNLLFIRRLGIKLNFEFDPIVWKYYLMQSLPLGMMFFFSQVNFKSDTILMSVLRLPPELGLNNKETVAIYSLGYKIFEVALVVPTFLMNSVYPVLIKHMLESKEKLKGTFSKTMLFLGISGVIAGLIGIILAPWTIKLLGGDEFTQSVPILRILLGGLFIYYVTQPISWLLVTLEKQIYLPYIYLVSAIFNLMANWFYIQRYSFFASAWITHISELIILILLIFTARKVWKMHYGS